MTLLGIIFFAGVLHGLGPDHLAAITAFGAGRGQNFRRIGFFALRFAAGHAAVIALAGLLGYFGHKMLPAAWERRCDLFGGALLVVTGVVLLLGLITGRVALHSHEHAHPQGPHRHLHMHFRVKDRHWHMHGSLALGLGALFALGGARTLLAVVPIVLAQTAAVSLLRVGAFTLGITVAMTGYGLLAARALSRVSQQGSIFPARPHLAARLASFAVAFFSIAAGMMTIASRLQV